MIHEGSCHCGDVIVRLDTSAEGLLPVRTCGCTFCQRVRPVYTSDPGGKATFTVHGDLHRYRFGQGTADFASCARCGTYLGAMTETESGLRCVINVAGLLIGPLLGQSATPMGFDAEDVEARNSRRAKNWTPAEIVEVR